MVFCEYCAEYKKYNKSKEMSLVNKLLKSLACRSRKFHGLYIRLCNPGGVEYADYLKRIDYFHSMGDKCLIWPYTNITDPKYVKIGNNVVLTNCTVLGHDGSIDIINKVFDVKVDSVGSVIIGDNVFVGHGAIILPNVSVGPNAIVGAGSVVTKNVLMNTIVGGVPARKIGTLDKFMQKLQKKTDDYPWRDLVRSRTGSYDPVVEAELIKQRVDYFFNDEK